MNFKNTHELDVGSGRKAVEIFVSFPQLKSWQKIQQKVVRELEKNFSDYEKYLAKTNP